MKRSMKKRYMALLLVLAMVTSLLPTTAFAAVTPPTVTPWVQEKIDYWTAPGQGYVKLGYLAIPGSDLYQYALTKNVLDPDVGVILDYVLIIQPGNGAVDCAIPNYVSASASQPWSQGKPSRVYIADGVTGIGDHAFDGLQTIKTVELEDSSDITRIGEAAFKNCDHASFNNNKGLDLSNMKSLGASAFSSCSRLSSVTLGSGLGEIPDYALNGCGLTSLTIPDTVTAIGNYALAYNQLKDSLVIPDQVKTIGSHAFYVGSDSKNNSLLKIVLGADLESIGEYAFSNYIGLLNVDIRTTAKPGNPLVLGARAFGHNENDAHSHFENFEIDGQTVSYLVGTNFKFVNDAVSAEDQQKVLDQFISGENCFLGVVTPLKLIETIPPTCLTRGKNTYRYKLDAGNGNVVQKDLYEDIPILEHTWQRAEPYEIPASCERDGGTLEYCGLAKALVKKGQDTEIRDEDNHLLAVVLKDGRHYRFTADHAGKPALGHNYQPSSVKNPLIDATTGSGSTILTYSCTHDCHIDRNDPNFKSYGGVLQPDNLPKNVSIRVNWKNLPVTTETTLEQITGLLGSMVENQNRKGSLSVIYGAGQDGSTTLSAGEHTLNLSFIPSEEYQSTYTNMAAASQFGGKALQLKINVKKKDLDFTKVYFKDAGTTVSAKLDPVHTTVDADKSTVPKQITGSPVFRYRPATDLDAWQNDPPQRKNSDSWVVKAEYRIDPDRYDVTKLNHQNTGYNIFYENGLVTITAPYHIVARAMSSIKAITANGVYGDGNEATRLQLTNVPEGSSITYTVTKDGVKGEAKSMTAEGSDWEATKTVSVGSFPKAGVYSVDVTVENSHYSPNAVTINAGPITVEKQSIAVPTGIELTYRPGTKQTGVPADASVYSLGSDCSQTDANHYSGTVTLLDPYNTKWISSDLAAIQVPYVIHPMAIKAPTADPEFKAPECYNGKTYTAVKDPTDTALTYTTVDGERIGTLDGSTVVTVTDASRKDAGSYHTVAKLNNPTGKQNYVWSGTSDDSSDRTILANWEIKPYSAELPAIAVDTDNVIEYSGSDLDLTTIKFNTNVTRDKYVLSLVDTDQLTVFGYTWLQNGSDMGLVRPSAVGNYQLRVRFQLSDGAKYSNYKFDGDDNTDVKIVEKTISFEISKKVLTLTPEADLTVPYTGKDIAMPAVTITDGLIGKDVDHPENVALQYSYTPAGDGQTPQTQNSPFAFRNAGTYQVTVGLQPGGNYEAESVNVTLTITAADQTITLKKGADPVPKDSTVSAALGDPALSVVPTSSVGGVDVTNQVDYTFSSTNSAVAAVAQDGTVTIHGVGTADITVNAAMNAAMPANLKPAQITYHIQVGKAASVLKLDAQEKPFTGKKVTDYKIAQLSGVVNPDDLQPTGEVTYTFYQGTATENAVLNGSASPIAVPSNAGTYWLKASYPGDGNYLAAQAAKKLTISASTLEIGKITGYSGTYDGQEHAPADLTSVTGVGGAALNPTDYQTAFLVTDTAGTPSADAEGWSADLKVKNVADSSGSAKYYWCRITADNYKPLVRSFTVNVAPRPLELSAQVSGTLEKDYDGTTALPAGAEVTDRSTGIAGEDTVNIKAAGAFADKAADSDKAITLTYTITFDSAALAGNYSCEGRTVVSSTQWTASRTAAETGTVRAKVLAVTGVEATGRVYDGTKQIALKGTPATDGIIKNDKLTLSLSGTARGTVESADAGSGKAVTVDPAAITLVGKDAGNYTVGSVNGTTVDIAKRPVRLVFDGIGESNTITEAFTGDPVNVTVKPVSPAKPNEGFVGPDQLNAGDVKYTYTGKDSAHIAQGSYTVRAQQQEAASGSYQNYELIFPEDATLLITPASLVVAALPYQGTYKAAAHDVTGSWSIASTVPGLTLENTKVLFQKKTRPSAPGADDAGWSEISFTDVAQSGDYWYQVTADNHAPTVGTNPVSITISPAAISVSGIPDSFEKTYDGADTVTTALDGISVTGLNAEPLSITKVSGSYADKNQGSGKAVKIQLTLFGASAWGNYSYKGSPLTDSTLTIPISGKGTILKKPITVTGGVTAAYSPRPFDNNNVINLTGTPVTDGFVSRDKVYFDSADEKTGTVTDPDASTAPKSITVTAAVLEQLLQGEDKNNYQISSDYTGAQVTISKKPVTLCAPDKADRVSGYTGSPIGSSHYAVTDRSGGFLADVTFQAEDIQYTFTGDTYSSTQSPTDQGTYTVTPALKDSAADKYQNYQISFDPANYTVSISAAALDVALNDGAGSWTYDGTAHPLSGLIKSVSGNGSVIPSGGYQIVFVKSDTKPSDWSGAVASAKNVADSGTYYYKITAPNYEEKTGSVTVTVSARELTVTPQDPNSFTKSYNGSNVYNVTNPDAPVTATVTGEAGTEEITAAVQSASFASINAVPQDLSLKFRLSGANLANYTFGGAAISDSTVTVVTSGKITRANLTLKVATQEKIYDGSKTVSVATDSVITPSGLIDVDEGSISFTIKDGTTVSTSSADVGTYRSLTIGTEKITILGTGSDNYTIESVTTKAEITRRPVSLKWPSVMQGDYRISGYTSAVFGLIVDTGNFITGDNYDQTSSIAYTVTDSNGETVSNATPISVGTYKIYPVLNDQPWMKNYTITLPKSDGTFIIAQNNVTLTVTPTLADPTYDGTAQALLTDITVTASDDGRFGAENCTIHYAVGRSAEKTDPTEFPQETHAGTYQVHCLVVSDNYAEVRQAVPVTIKRAPLTINRSVESSRIYNGTIDANAQIGTPSLSGTDITKPDRIQISMDSAVYDAAAVASASQITVTYTVTGDDLTNYSIRITDSGTAEDIAKADQWTGTECISGASITPAPVTVRIADQTSVYDGAVPTAGQDKDIHWSVDSGTVFQADGSHDDDLDIALTIADAAADAGAYAITGTAGNGNYSVTFTGSQRTAGTYTVTPRPISVTIGSTSGVYGDSPVVTASEGVVTLTDSTAPGADSGLVPGESLYTVLTGAELSTTATAVSPISSTEVQYPITEENGTYGNYTVTFTDGTYTVKPRPITLTIADKESAYGCAPAEPTVSDSYTGAAKNGIVNRDDLGIALTREVTASTQAGTYPITGETTRPEAGNYQITWSGSWAGEDSGKGIAGTYTVRQADLSIAFEMPTVNVAMGNAVNNPLNFTNVSNSAVLEGKPSDAAVRYESSDESVATVDGEGQLTILKDGNITISATVTSGGRNFTTDDPPDTASYSLNVAKASAGIQVTVKPNSLTYTGNPQELVTGTVITPANTTIQYQLNGTAEDGWSSVCPKATDAKLYTVNWRASSSGYTTISGSVPVEIRQAAPTTGFSKNPVSTTYQEGKVYNSTADTVLNVNPYYTGETGHAITFLSNNTQVAEIQDNDPASIRLNGTGTAVISAQFAATSNFQAQTVSFTLNVGTSATTIDYSASDYSIVYDGQSHGSQITVNSPSVYSVKYSSDQGISYTLDSSPTITDVGSTTIYFQIQSRGYASVNGTQTVTVKQKSILEGDVHGIDADTSFTYTGGQITPTVTVDSGSTLLTPGRDYTVSYGSNRNVGKSSDVALSSGGGYVKVTGQGNYTGSVTKYFAITAVKMDYLTAVLDRYFGSVGDTKTDHAAVTLKHGNQTLLFGADYTVSCTQDGASVDSSTGTVTFSKVGSYSITVTGKGSYEGEITLGYALLPVSDGLNIQPTGSGDTDAVQVLTYGAKIQLPTFTVKADGATGETSDFTLSYQYIPFVGDPQKLTQAMMQSRFDGVNLPDAGVYTVTATGTGDLAGSSGVFNYVFQKLNLDYRGTPTEPGVVAEFSDPTAAAVRRLLSAPAPYQPTFTGSAITPTVTLTYNGTPIGALNAPTYSGNIDAGTNTAQVLSSAAASNNNFSGLRADSFSILPKNINATGITVEADPVDYSYTGNVVTPTANITDKDRRIPLVDGTDYFVTASNTEPGTWSATVTGTGNYSGSRSDVSFTIVSGGTAPTKSFEMTLAPTSWTWTDPLSALSLDVRFGTTDLTCGTDYKLVIDGTDYTVKDDALAAIRALQPNASGHSVKAVGLGAYLNSSDAKSAMVSKYSLPLTIQVDPSLKSGSGEVSIQVTPGTWPTGLDSTGLTVLNVRKNGVAEPDLQLKFDPISGTYKPTTFTVGNETAQYTFHIDAAQIAGYNSTCYELQITGGLLTTVQQTGGGGGGAGGTIVVGPGDAPAEQIHHLAYVYGRSDNTFQPNANITRAESAAIFARLLSEGKEIPTSNSCAFEDVPADAWYYDYVAYLQNYDIVRGRSATQFDPLAPITRAEFVTICTRFYVYGSVDTVNDFTDVPASHWAYAYINFACHEHWITGFEDQTFRPDSPITRAEAVCVVNRMLGRTADRDYLKAHADEVTFSDLSPDYWAYDQIMEAAITHSGTKDSMGEHWSNAQR